MCGRRAPHLQTATPEDDYADRCAPPSEAEDVVSGEKGAFRRVGFRGLGTREGLKLLCCCHSVLIKVPESAGTSLVAGRQNTHSQK